MHDKHYDQKPMSPIAAGITGLILGIVGTAAVALSDKDTRKKVTKKANEMRDNLEKWSKDTLHDAVKTRQEITKNASDAARDIGKQAEERSDELKEENKKEL